MSRRPHPTIRRPGRARAAVALAAAAFAGCVAASAGPAPAVGASSATVVSATVPSATNVDASTCAPGVAGSTSLGVVLPGSTVLGTVDCTITFGSSNDTSMLRVFQSDETGAAMWRAAHGPLDPTFGGTGKVVVPMGSGSDTPVDVLVQRDGRILVVGEVGPSPWSAGVVRLNDDGSLDGTWGTGGRSISTLGSDVRPQSATLQPDGKLVIAGAAWNGSSTNAFVARYTTAGVLDPGFGTGGKVVLPLSGAGATDAGGGLAVQPDGAILVASESSNDLSLTRLAADGSVDTGFATAGTASVPVGPGFDTPRDVLVQADGRIVVDLDVTVGAGNDEWGLVRLTSAGVVDGTFGTAGKVVTSWGGGTDHVHKMLQQPDGKIVVSGDNTAADIDLAVARFSTTGVVDPTFGMAGLFTLPHTGTDKVKDLFRLPDGRLVLGGYGAGVSADFAAARITSAGVLDTTFNGVGYEFIPVGTGSDKGYGVALGTDGKVVVAGEVAGATNDFGAIRLDATSVADYAIGSADWATGNAFGACLQTATAGALGGAGVSGWPTAGAGNCTAANAASWRPVVATSALAGAKVAAVTGTPTAAAQVTLRFGMRAGAAQPSGDYLAPVTFEVLAPYA